ncbi:MAG: carotenoid 1,2-hydratase [Pseudomonadota bacterium]
METHLDTKVESLSNLVESPIPHYFDSQVPVDGYRWWYCDIVSDDHQYCVVIIGFIGSVFSPYYASARRRGPADPEQHCAINAILYAPGSKRWAMTERGSGRLERLAHGVRVGPSDMQFDGDKLVINIRERCNPLPLLWEGRIELTPQIKTAKPFGLHSNGLHHWWPYAPVATARVQLTHPQLSFTGSGYIDTNFGREPLEQGFEGWDWTRRESSPTDGSTPAITYHSRERSGLESDLTLALTPDGMIKVPTPSSVAIAPGFWRVPRQLRSTDRILNTRTLEDTPFYVRSLLTAGDHAKPYCVMHESLDLDRFASRWVQTLLPFRMPRLA